MSLFTSHRERRLWAWTLAVVVAIYSALGVAPKLAGALVDRNLLENAFIVALIVIGATIVVGALRTKPGRVEIGVALGVAAVYVICGPDDGPG